MRNQLENLNDIVYGQSAPTIDTSDVVGQEYISRSEKWLADNSSANDKEKFEGWMEFVSDWTFTPNNREYYWDKMAQVMPGSDEGAKKTIIGDIVNKLNGFSTLEEKTEFYRDNAYGWSRDIHTAMGDYFFAMDDLQKQKDVAKLRMNQVAEVDRLFNDYTFKDLDPHVSLNAHTEDALKAYNMGYGEHLKATNGRISAPFDGVDTAVFSLPNPVMDIHEEVISKSDLFNRIKKKLKPQLEKSRQEYREAEKVADLALLSRVEGGQVPREFVSNVIIDGVTYGPKPFDRAVAVMQGSVEKRMQQRTSVSPGQAVRDFYAMYQDVKDKVTRRVSYDSNA
jgi:hypothetical protein